VVRKTRSSQLALFSSNQWSEEPRQVTPSGQDWVIPIGAVVGREFTIRSQDVSLQVGAYYNVKRPNGTAAWVLATGFSWVH
jgi:hypothetical protein